MYEQETFEVILQRVLERVSPKIDKREGSFVWDGTAPTAVELQNLYIAIDTVLNEVFVDTASREYLIKRCAERGIKPKPASYATVTGQFTPANLEIPIGTRFSHEDFNYAVTKKISEGLYYLQCETLGSEVNGVTGQLIPIDYVIGLQTAEIIEVSFIGEDEEDTESLRARYIESISSESFSGNRAYYKQKILSLPGVGGVKLYTGSEWNGGGTIKAVIANSNHGVPSDELVEQVQTVIDPEMNSGEGDGWAIIGHFVTVVGAYNTVVNIETVMTYDVGYSWAKVKNQFESMIDAYLAEQNKSWQNMGNIIVRIAQIESRVLNIPGIIDIQGTKLNGKAENLTIDKDSLVSRGTINGE